MKMNEENEPFKCKVMNTSEGLRRPNADNGPIRPFLYYVPQSVLESTVCTKQVLYHTCSMS